MLERKIDRAIEKEAMKTGKMGTEEFPTQKKFKKMEEEIPESLYNGIRICTREGTSE